MSRPRRAAMGPKGARDDVIGFFRSVLERRFTDAERTLGAVREKPFGNSEFKAGYINALDGILLSLRSGDPRDFVNKAPFDTESMENYNRDFARLVRDGTHTHFDVGYFSAWSDFLHYRLNAEKEGQMAGLKQV